MSCAGRAKRVLGLLYLTRKPLLPQEVGRSRSRTVAWGSWEGSGWSHNQAAASVGPCMLRTRLAGSAPLSRMLCASGPAVSLHEAAPLGLMEGHRCQRQTMFLLLVMSCRDWEPSTLWCQMIPRGGLLPCWAPCPSLCLSITPKGPLKVPPRR